MANLIEISKRGPPKSVGNKAVNIGKLAKIGRRTPRTFAIPWDAYDRYLGDDPRLIFELQNELSKITDPDKLYAVRSSANIEDSPGCSFAGQFKSVLRVQGVNSILLAVWSVWCSAETPAVKIYFERHGIQGHRLSMAVIIQEMVRPVFSGVSLSCNPVTGSDEIVVEAIQGDGSLLVQGGLTPDRWVNKWGYWVEKAKESKVPLAMVEEIISQTRIIAKKLHHPVDLEWVHNGRDLYWVQVRPITTLSNRNI